MTDTQIQRGLYCSTVLDYGATKHSALFFDHVVPIDGIEGLKYGVEPELCHDIVRKLLPPDFDNPAHVDNYVKAASRGITGSMILAGWCNDQQYMDEFIQKIEEPPAFMKYVNDPQTPIVLRPEYNQPDPDAPEPTDESKARLEDAVITLAQLQVPNTDTVSWDTIFALREDPDARKRLRRIRVFANDEYTGKPQSYIHDDIATRLDEYEQTLKDWRIESSLGGMSMALSMQSAIQAGLVGVFFTLAGVSNVGTLATTLSVPIAHGAMEIAKSFHARQKAVRNFPLAYIFDVRQAATSTEGSVT